MRFNRRLALFLRYYLGCIFYGTLLLFIVSLDSFIFAIIDWLLLGGFVPFGISYWIQGKVLKDKTNLLDILWLLIGVVTNIISNLLALLFLFGFALIGIFSEFTDRGVIFIFSYFILGIIQLLQIRYIVRFARYKKNYIQSKGDYNYE